MHVTHRRWVVLGIAALLLVSVACTNDTLDDGGGADVVLQIQALSNEPVTAVEDPDAGTCTIVIQSWAGTIAAVPLNETATTDFSNVRMQDVTVIYDWINPSLSTPTRVIGLGGATVQVDGTGTIDFDPISFNDLTSDKLGQTCNMTLVFRGMTQDNEVVTVTAFRQLFVEVCA